MEKKISHLIEPGARLHFLVMLLFSLITCYFSVPAGIAEFFAVALLYLYSRRILSKRRREIAKYVESLVFRVDNVSRSSLMSFPLPAMVASASSGKLLWCNEAFSDMAGLKGGFFDITLSEAIPGFSTADFVKSPSDEPVEVSFGERLYAVYGNLIRAENGRHQDADRDIILTLYWIDITDYTDLRRDYENSRPVVSVVMIDNYDELLKNSSDTEKSTLLAAIDKVVTEWITPTNGLLRKFDRDKYLVVIDEQSLRRLAAEKFKVLDAVKEIRSSEGIVATLSIGIGRDGKSLYEALGFSNLSIDMALSRGGDQVVIKDQTKFDFFGGRALGTETRTKVRSRVLANALSQLILDSSVVLIMGHKMSDIDSVGAAAGVVCICRKLGRRSYIVTDEEQSSARDLIDRLKSQAEYEYVFIDGDEAMALRDMKSLVVVVDTNRPDVVEHPPLLAASSRVAVIDHHRRAASYIENCAVNMHEPYASSASELVTELIQYTVSARDVLRAEAEALLAGIYLDTKAFAMKAGVRTFEAAAYLKRLGADTTEVKRLFQNDFQQHLEKNRIVEHARMAFDTIAVARADFEVTRAIAGQAADELLSITNIQGAVVLFHCDGKIYASARSLGQVNMQVIMEKMGGGGSLTNAGAQLDMTMEEAEKLVMTALASYFEEAR